MRPHGLRAALTLCLMLLAPLGVAAQSRTVTPEETRKLAADALLSGYPAHALELATALIALDPTDTAALVTASQASRAMGRNDDAIAFARRANTTADTRSDRFYAARATAQALAADGKRTRAQLWLRRAAQNAPTPGVRAQTIQEFRYVRGRNPWRSQLSFGIAPSSNINDGSASGTVLIYGIPFQLSGGAQALSGTELSLGAATERRWRTGRRTILSFGARVEARRYWLSSEAKDLAPDVEASDYAFTSAELAFGLQRAPKGYRPGAIGPGIFTLRFALGKGWYGGDDLLTYSKLQAQKAYRFSKTTAGYAALTAEWQNRLDDSNRSQQGLTLQAGLSRRFAPGTLSLNAHIREVESDANDVSHSAWGVGAGWTLAKPVLTARTTFSVSFEEVDRGYSAFGADRIDRRKRLGVTMLFSEAELYGFAPEVGIDWRVTDSTVDFYSTEEVGLRLGLKSTF